MKPDTSYLSLKSALEDRLMIISDRALRESNPTLQMDQLRAVSERIVQLQENLLADCHPQLKHYLQNCSYDKALAWLQSMAVAT